jgi:hypothetical protein
MRPLREIEADITNCLKEIHEARDYSSTLGLPPAERQAAQAAKDRDYAEVSGRYWKLIEERNAFFEANWMTTSVAPNAVRGPHGELRTPGGMSGPPASFWEVAGPGILLFLVMLLIGIGVKKNPYVRLVAQAIGWIVFVVAVIFNLLILDLVGPFLWNWLFR